MTTLFDIPPRGATFIPELDAKRLAKQTAEVHAAVSDGAWRTLAELEQMTGHPQASISARLRQLRSMGFTVERRRRGEPASGLFEYRLTIEGQGK